MINMDCLPFVARCYVDVVRRLGVVVESWTAGRATFLATTAPLGEETLAALSELALAAICGGGGCCGPGKPPASLRIGLVVSVTVWSGAIRATAQTRPCGDGTLLACEVRDGEARLLSTAFARLPG